MVVRKKIFGAQQKKATEPPDLLELQRDSFRWFLEEGLPDELKLISPIKGFHGKLELSFTGKCVFGKPKYSPSECLIRETTYAMPLKVETRLLSKESKEVKSQEVFIGDLPIMTERGTFIINGAERVIVSQLVRSPGVYYRESKRVERTGKIFYYATVIPDRGAMQDRICEIVGENAMPFFFPFIGNLVGIAGGDSVKPFAHVKGLAEAGGHRGHISSGPRMTGVKD